MALIYSVILILGIVLYIALPAPKPSGQTGRRRGDLSLCVFFYVVMSLTICHYVVVEELTDHQWCAQHHPVRYNRRRG